MKKLIGFITLILLFTVNFSTVALGRVYTKEYMVNPFYAVKSSAEYGQVKEILLGDSSHMYFQWGRISMNKQEKMVFTNKVNSKISSYDNRTEYGFPGDDNLKDYKKIYPKGKTFLSVFFDTYKYAKGKNSAIELLNMTEEEWTDNIIKPMIEMMIIYEFDGVVLDFEGFRNKYDSVVYLKEEKTNMKLKYNAFLKCLKEALGEKEIIVCIHPTNVAGGYDGYDYKFLNNTVNYVLLMAYGYEHKIVYDKNAPKYLQGKIKTVGIYETQPYKKVKEAVDNLINKEGVTANKLILGLDLGGMKYIKLKKVINGKSYEYYEYARPYLNDIENLSVKEEYLKNDRISKKTLNKNQILQKDKDAFEKSGAEIQKVDYYYESDKSLYYKYNDIVQAYDLSGLSVWRLGIGSEKAWSSLISNASNLQ